MQFLYAREDAARLLAISLRKLDYLIQQNALKTVKVGKRTLISHTELENFAGHGTGKHSGIGGRDAQ
jgi:excisionase family DNA binding protein